MPWPPEARICLPAWSPLVFHVRNWLSSPTEKPVLPSGLNGHAVDAVLMVGEGEHRFLRRQVPDLGRLVAAAGQQVLAVRREGDAEDPVGVVLDRLFQLRLAAMPADRSQTLTMRSQPPGGQFLAVGAEGQAQHLVVGCRAACLSITFGSLTPSRTATPFSTFGVPPLMS